MYAVPALASSLSLARGGPAIIGLDDSRHQFVADHVLMSECDMADTLDACEQLHSLGEP
jgi:hypothetical protein